MAQFTYRKLAHHRTGIFIRQTSYRALHIAQILIGDRIEKTGIHLVAYFFNGSTHFCRAVCITLHWFY